MKTLLLSAAFALLAGSASAHVSLEAREAPVGSTFKAVLRVPHGCEGKPTTKLRVQVPEGFIGVKAQPKAGWTLEKVKGAYAKAYDYYGTPMKEGVKEVIWEGGSLADDEYDEFVLRGTLSAELKPGETLFFPVVQECPDGATERWVERPAKGQTSEDLELPAPGILLLPKSGS
ncbi:YcnI family protein [Rhizobium sp. CC-YZS058]|uniref:YcnI family copper-binding membrane protein n=1 Tax=Rhizobium sp. CC-YZS058 TaxID=3042153 RepID=UPI002B05E3DD|nr:DUF1775 domain-containing protein [Rhizobium sp. CC-YZS058]MEA3534310.1 DUF1775 domain-containing protein [Rhizobium sp. CC-YZS058]